MSEKPEVKKDERGKLIEIFKDPGFGQVYYLTSAAGIIRGNHYHERKEEKFCAIEGEGKILLKSRETGEIKEYFVSGESPEIIDVPKNWSHNIENVGSKELKILAWISEVYNPDDPDTYPEKI